MARVRLSVALLVPPIAAEIDGLRRACAGDRSVARVPPHITLVPPVNVRTEAVPDALAVLRAAAAGRAADGPLHLQLGPPEIFHPATETLYLAVAGSGVHELRDAVFQPPLARTLSWPFVPHLTLAEGIPEDRARAAVTALADYAVTVAVERVHLLEERHEPAGRCWVPVADVPFTRPAVVGRGGVELELWRGELLDPETTALVGRPGPTPSGAVPCVVTARRRGRLVGVVHGWVRDGTAEEVGLFVVTGERGQGIGRQLRLAFAAVPS